MNTIIFFFVALLVLALLIGLFDLERLKRLAGNTRVILGIVLVAIVIGLATQLGYLRLPAFLGGAPVVGNEIPSMPRYETPAPVTAPKGIAPAQPDSSKALEDNRRQMEQLRKQGL